MSHDLDVVRPAHYRQRLACAAWRWCLLLLALAWSALPVVGQIKAVKDAIGKAPGSAADSAALSTDGSETPATLEARLAEARTALAALSGTAGISLTNAVEGIPAQEILVRRSLLQRLVRVYEQQASTIAELESTRKRRAELALEAQTWTAFAEPKPYSILLLDGLHESVQAERLKLNNAADAAAVMDRVIEDNRSALRKSEENVRRLNEQLETAGDPTTMGRLSWERDLERLRGQVASATMSVLDAERKLQEEKQGESRARLGLLQRQVVMAQGGALFTEADLAKIVDRLEAERKVLEEELSEAESQQKRASAALETARAESRRVQDQVSANAASVTRAAEQVELRQTQLETADTAVKVYRFLLDAGNTERSMWEMRLAAHESRSADVLRASRARLVLLTRRVNLWRDFQRQQLAASSSQLAIQQARIASLDPASDLLPLARERLASLQLRDQLLLRFLRGLDRARRLAERWQEGLQDAAGKLPFTGRLRNLFSDTESLLSNLWNFELFTAVDTITVDGQPITGKRSITIGKVILALLILVGGIWLSDLLARFIEPIIVRRLKIEPNQANLIRRWLRALLVLGLILFSLLWVKIPLTVFAFAGGALAIGIGFGIQTFLKNLISGVIILFERPFRVGDVLDIGGQKGMVTTIGLRASVLQLWDGTENLIPNSALLENTVTNWTYSNRTVRFTISVGVAYESDTRRVVQLLGEVAERHGLVEKTPKPVVLFTDFGDSALIFELRFWMDVVRGNPAMVCSDLRQMIAGAFSENRIVIAFPQREVRLAMAQPLAVQVLPPSAKP